MDAEEQARNNMVIKQIENRGISNQSVLQSIKKVPRHLFVPPAYRHAAYGDHPLPTSCGQTISQPYIVALMTELLVPQKHHKALEIGTGTGYQTAILAELVQEVYTIEIYSQLQETAKNTLTSLGYQNIRFILGNGYEGYLAAAPYDLILVTAAPPYLPENLVEQLALGGTMVIPFGKNRQMLYVISKNKDGSIHRKEILPVVFVTMQDRKPLN
ncbi:protein-L-isoaspartate(D-aspartate) O-methyltransferase [Microbacter margulisiae]|uniref:Protein-L-isoaspartate O-methyltransferase n=1 Tax=Microbacter margulisiae TaxID=1350067 RepID=A0A7W5DQV6_9PORP|nr:protein-L-isoaspartate(D-aspartate) O-methyltransferase [Microbacter margulisiae]MBB3187065.1 protein-L-isoaspartate(D-aspartate) O-methyltransferase [Microbacter margulisiae]